MSRRPDVLSLVDSMCVRLAEVFRTILEMFTIVRSGDMARHISNPAGDSPGGRISQVMSTIIDTGFFYSPSHQTHVCSATSIWASPTGVRPPRLMKRSVRASPAEVGPPVSVRRSARLTYTADDVRVSTNAVGAPSTASQPPRMESCCVAWAIGVAEENDKGANEE